MQFSINLGLRINLKAHSIRHSPSPCVFTTSPQLHCLKFSQEWLKMEPGAGNSETHLRIKTQLCRRFMQGTCSLGPNCKYAHGFNDLRATTAPKLCRMFMQNGHCSYGHNCRFLHGTHPPLHHHHHHQHENINFSSPQPRIFLQLLSFTTLTLLFDLVLFISQYQNKKGFPLCSIDTSDWRRVWCLICVSVRPQHRQMWSNSHNLFSKIIIGVDVSVLCPVSVWCFIVFM